MKSVYTGGEKVAEFESYDELRVGDGKPAFIYEGNELVYPNPVKDGLVLWYDFSGRTNTDGQRGIAEDLSGNGNHGTLQNFNYTTESGYEKNKLLFDGVDDFVPVTSTSSMLSTKFTWAATITPIIEETGNDTMFMYGNSTAAYFRIQLGRLGAAMRGIDSPVDYTHTSFRMETGVTYYVCLVYDNGSYYIYANGVQVGESHSSLKDIEYTLSWIGRYTGSSLRSFNGDFHSVKVYNRPLSPEEIAHNYAIEKERFGIE